MNRLFNLILAALACLALVGCDEKTDPLRLGSSVVPVSQTVMLSLDPDADDYCGTSLIEVTFKEYTDSFRFHARNMELKSVKLAERPLTFDVGRKGTVIAAADQPIRPGTYLLEIEFCVPFSNKGTGIYKVSYEGRNYLFSQLSPEHARESFPCWDDPKFRIPWQLTIATPANNLVFSNTPVQEESSTGNINATTFFRTKPTAPHLLSLAVGEFNFVKVDGQSTRGRIYTPHGKAALVLEAARISPQILQSLEFYLRRPYPSPKLDQVAAPCMSETASGGTGLINHRDTNLYLDSKATTTEDKQQIALSITRKTAHMWFGNLVTSKWWSDLWLNESGALWLSHKIAHKTFPAYGLENWDLVIKQQAMAIDALPSAQPVQQHIPATTDMSSLQDEAVYNKGFALFNMAEGWLGEDAFRQSMVNYIKRNEWKNTSVLDLAKALESEAGKPITSALQSYILNPGLPLIKVEPLRWNRVRISQQRYYPYGVKWKTPKKWNIPVILKYSDGKDVHTKKVMLTHQTQIFRIKHNPEWIYPDADETGYYHWRLPTKDFKAMAFHTSVLDERTRIGFINNYEALYSAGIINSGEYLRTLTFFSIDPSSEVMDAVCQKLTAFYNNMIPADLRASYGKYLSNTLQPMLDRIGTEYTAGESVHTESLRAHLIAALGEITSDPTILEIAKEKTAVYMVDPYTVDPSLAKPFLRLAAAEGDAELLKKYIQQFESEIPPHQKENYLTGMAGFNDSGNMQQVLSYILTDKISPCQFMSVLSQMASTDEQRWIIFDWVKASEQSIRKKLPNNMLSQLPWVFNGQSADLFNEASTLLLGDEPRNNKRLEKELVRVLETVKLNLALREKEQPNIREFLNK